MATANKRVVLTGLVTFDGNHVHRRRLIKVLGDMGIESLERLPANPEDTTLVVGTLLKGRKTRVITAAEKKKINVTDLDDFLTPSIRNKLRSAMEDADDLQPYERSALRALQGKQKGKAN